MKLILSSLLLLILSIGSIYSIALVINQFYPYKSDTLNNSKAEPVTDNQVIVYYFYTNADSLSCINIQEYTQEALQLGFNLELECDMIRWQPVDINTADNKYYIQEYKLTKTSIVLAKFKSGKLVTYKLLPNIWSLLENKKAFMGYIKTETALMLYPKEGTTASQCIACHSLNNLR